MYSYSLNLSHLKLVGKSTIVYSFASWFLFFFLFLFLFSNLSSNWGTHSFSFWSLLIFSSGMSACDVSLTLPYLQTNPCNIRIASFFEVEAVVSELLSILSYQTLTEIQLQPKRYNLLVDGLFQFLYFMLISIGVGVISGLLVVFIMWIDKIQKGEKRGEKRAVLNTPIQDENESEEESEKEYYEDEDGEVFQMSVNLSDKNLNFQIISFFFVIPIMAYMVAEGLHASGVTAIHISGIILSYYSKHYLNKSIYPLLRIKKLERVF